MNYRDNDIDGWMDTEELRFLYDLSTKYKTIAEVGSWKGRSTHALLSGGAHVTAIDTWRGADNDITGQVASQVDVFQIFSENLKGFPNLTTDRRPSLEADKAYSDNSFDVVFIDANHGFDEVKNDIRAWTPKAKHIICGHDYGGGWTTVTEAVDSIFLKPDGVTGTIWWVDVNILRSSLRSTYRIC